jgi:glutathione S-transferase
MDVLEQAVSASDYVAGDRFSAADLMLAHQIGFGLMFKSIDQRPAFTRYWSRISARPAHVRASQMDDALLGRVGGG